MDSVTFHLLLVLPSIQTWVLSSQTEAGIIATCNANVMKERKASWLCTLLLLRAVSASQLLMSMLLPLETLKAIGFQLVQNFIQALLKDAY